MRTNIVSSPSVRHDRRPSSSSNFVSTSVLEAVGDHTHNVAADTVCGQYAAEDHKDTKLVQSYLDDDLDVDLAKAALTTGTEAFEMQEWEEANCLLQEASQALQQLPKQQQSFCDLFNLQYRLAVCAYHTQEPAHAEGALLNLIQQSSNSDEHRKYAFDATHLLSQLYVRTGQIDRAHAECEKALQGRRRLFGKLSDASLESTALMAHIYVLLNNRARAKMFLAIIPEARRDAVLKDVQESLTTKMEHLEFSSPLTRSAYAGSDLDSEQNWNRLSTSSFAPSMETRCYGPIPNTMPQSSIAVPRRSNHPIPPKRTTSEDWQQPRATRFPSSEAASEYRPSETAVAIQHYCSDPEVFRDAAPDLAEPRSPASSTISKTPRLTRKEIIENIGCQPRDQIEEAVCNGDHSAFTNLLGKRKDFWRSKVRKHVRSERVTALHFAALFGELNMARSLLDSGFKVNEVPYGYSTSLTPLKFAIGARQVEMIECLIANGAKPCEPDSWSTLAGQVMNRSWLKKTMSEADRESTPDHMISIFRTLLKHGWNVNAPTEASGKTVLHQAVTFWTGSYRWDLSLRNIVTSFLCEHSADPLQTDTEGKRPYDIALASGDQEILSIFDRVTRQHAGGKLVEPIELSGDVRRRA